MPLVSVNQGCIWFNLLPLFEISVLILYSALELRYHNQTKLDVIGNITSYTAEKSEVSIKVYPRQNGSQYVP